MSFASLCRWFAHSSTSPRHPRHRQRGKRPPLGVEFLEDRTVPTANPLPGLTVDPTLYDQSHILVRFQPNVTDPASLQIVPGTQVTTALPLVSGLWEVSLSAGVSVEQAIAAYQASPLVVAAQPDRIIHLTVTPGDPSYTDLWGLNNTGQTGGTVDADIDAPEAWDVTTGSSSVIVAVLDTGVDYTHPDLAANIWVNAGEVAGNGVDDDGNGYVDDVHGYDFANNDGNPMDDHYHGTHVAGTIGAVGNNGIGVTGVAWNVKIMALKFLDASGNGTVSDAIEALNYAVQMGASISNNSYGGPPEADDTFFIAAIQNAAVHGHIFVAGAGNSGTNNDVSPFNPATYALDNIISVAATDHDDNIASFSNYGKNTVDLAAPGVGIYSTAPGNSYQSLDGTSMATPHVAGVVALVRSLHPDWTYQQVIDQVLSTVDPLPGLQALTATGGRINAYRALTAAPGPRVAATSPSGETGAPTSTMRVSFTKAINPATFTLADIVSFTGPNGALAVNSVTAVAGSDRQFDLAFDPQTARGEYQLVLGPNIADTFGNLMNQDGDGTAGEAVDDRYTASFIVTDQLYFHSTDTPKLAPGFVNTASYLTIDQDVNIADLNVLLNIGVVDSGFLQLSLTSPSGTTVSLKNTLTPFVGGNFDNTLFNDEADLPILSGSPPYAGAYKPQSPLSAFDGESALGTWRLNVNNLWFDGATLNAWTLIVAAEPPRLSVSDVSLSEGNNGDTLATFTVRLSNVIDEDVTVDYATSAGTATPGSDYENVSGSLTFAPGELTKTVTVVVHGDTVSEPDDTFFFNLSNVSPNASIFDAQAVGTIQNDETQVSISDVTITEGNSGTLNAIFTITLSQTSPQGVTVTYATADGTTTAGTDYTAASGTVNFASGETSKTVSVAIKGDTRNETDETFYVNLTGVTNAAITDGQGVGTIANDDAVPALSIANVSVTEGNAGTKTFTFTASLSAASGQTVTVDYATADGSAMAGADYVSAAGTLTFLAGQTSRTFTVTVTGDASAEADETFVVTLGNATNALLLDSQAIGTILNDDTSLAIDNVSVAEGDSGATAVTFTVSLSAPVGHEVRVHYATANGTAAAGSDYVAQSGNLVFAAGQTTQTITVLVLAETKHEPDQTFLVNLTAPVGALIADSQGVATIVNDDALPSVSVADFTVVEGNSGSKTVYFTLSLSAASGQTVSVGYTTADGSASAGSDYVAESGTVNIAAGATTATVGIVVSGDTVFEGDETFFLQLSNPTNAAIADGVGVATLGEDDSLKINDVTVSEGDSGAFALTFTVSLEQALDHDVTVDYATANSTAAAASDYVAASGKVTIAAGQTSATLTVLGISDLRNDADRAFKVNLTNAVGAVLADSQGTGTIVDNDPLPTVTIGDVVIAEGNSSTKNVTFTVSLSAASNRAVAVTYATADGSATAGSDYVAKSGTVNIGAGALSATFTVVVNGDTANEGDEAFVVDLLSATYGTLADNQAQAVLANDDPQPLVSITDAKVVEGNSNTKTLSFTVSLSAAATQTVTVNYATANGSATAGSDYTAQSGQLTFTAGQLSKTVAIVLTGDTVREADETFFVNLTAATNAGLLDAQGVGTLQNDDTSILISDATVDEGNSGTTTATFTVSIAQAVAYDVQASYATANSTAAVGNDYLAASGIVVIPAGQTSQTITVFVVGDANDDADETFVVNLTNPVNALIGDTQGVGTIRDDDALPGVTITDVVITEGQAGTKSAVFTVNLSAPSNRTVSVNYTTANGTATAASDYVAKSGTVNITAGSLAQTITIVLNGDAVAEGDEAFFVNLSGVVNGTLADSQGVATLTDDDSLKISDATATETDAGTFAVTYTVSIAQALGYDLTVDYATADGTADAGMDYLAASGSVTILAGQTSATITILGVGDVINEANETILVNLTNGGGLAIADSQGTGTLVENDPLPSLTITDVVVTEGNAGTKNVTFVATLSAASGRVVAFNYSTADGSASAAAGDYVAKTSSLSIAAGALSGSFTVVVNGDTAVESDETFLVNFSNVSNATLTTSQAQATVVNDDQSLLISFGGPARFSAAESGVAPTAANRGSGLSLRDIQALPMFLPDVGPPAASASAARKTFQLPTLREASRALGELRTREQAFLAFLAIDDDAPFVFADAANDEAAIVPAVVTAPIDGNEE